MLLPRRLHVLSLLIAVGAAHLVAQAPESIGILRSVSGPVMLIPATGATANQPVRLTPSSVSRPLFDGDAVKADPQGQVTVAISGRMRTIQLKGNRPVQLHPDRPATEAELRLDFAVKNFGAPGASRQVAGLVWWPANESSVRAHGFHVRWNPAGATENFTLSLTKEGGDTIWTSEPIESSLGRLKQEQEAAIEQLLLDGQSETEPQNYTLTIASEAQGEARTAFAVISKTEETRVESELHEWDKTQSDLLLRALGRASTFKSAHLTCEVAEEYQTALRLAPASNALLQAALAADRATGNIVRSRELAARLRNEAGTQ